MSGTYRINGVEETIALALNVAGWIVSEQKRAERMLSLTGLDSQTLRDRLAEAATLRALLDFVLDHEPDLIACAQAIGVKPADIADARRHL